MRMILIHGLGQTLEAWTETLAHLGTEKAECVDLPELLQGRACTYGALGQAFADCCGEKGEAVDLCGLSLGAVLALEYAVRHPERVRSLVLIGAQYKMPKLAIKLQNMVFRRMPAMAFRGMGFSKQEILLLTKSMENLDLSEELGRAACPALVVCGERDRANRRAAASLAERLPHAALRIIPGANHEVNVDAPEALAAAMRNFYGCNVPPQAAD